MAYYICAGQRGDWSAELGTLWRTSPDIMAPGERRAAVLWGGAIRNFYATLAQQSPPWSTFGNRPGGSDTCGPDKFGPCPGPVSAPGAWRDADMLVVGIGNLSLVEMRTHFSLWAMLPSPLWIGADLTRISPQALRVLLNREVIEVDRHDVAGIWVAFFSSSNMTVASR